MGKTLKSAIAEVEKCAAAFRHYAQNGPAMLADRTIAVASGTATAHWLPMGPVLAVMPWNFPYWQVVRFAAPTIMAGNVGLLKHASTVQGCAAAIQEMIVAAGAPAGLFQSLAITSDKVAGLIADERIVAVTLTGSEGAGMKVAEAAGRALKKVVLELGGSDPFIVMPSADLHKAAETAVKARIQNTGQSCICAKRMIVHADIYDRFMDRFCAGMKAVKAGDPMDPATDVGTVIHEGAAKTFERRVIDAVGKGAQLLHGNNRQGALYPPTVVDHVPYDCELVHEETFGPVIPIIRVPNDIAQVIRISNSTAYGLSSGVCTNRLDYITRFVNELDVGTVNVWEVPGYRIEMSPFGGIKDSGLGYKEGVVEATKSFTNVKTYSLPWPA